MKALVFISDNRMMYLAEILKEKGYSVETDVFEALVCASELDAVILPVRGVDERGYARLADDSVVDLNDFFNELKDDAVIFSGLINDYLNRLGRDIIGLFSSEIVAVQNAALTAEGVLHLLISLTEKSIFDYQYDIIGFGRSGSSINGLLSKLGLELRIVTNKGEVSARCMSYKEWWDGEPSEIIINTAPAEVITEDMAKRWKKDVTILDISSGAVGVSAEAEKEANVRVIKSPPLPGLVAPKSAAMILADFVDEQIKERRKWGLRGRCL